MKLDDYIHGARHGREAHDLEAEAMRDPFLGDALEGFDAVPGNHSAALERLAGRVGASAAGGRAAARSKAARARESHLRGWSVAAAAVFLVGVGGGVVWLLGEKVPTDPTRGTIAGRTERGGYGEVEAILPPVTVIENDTASTPTDLSDVRLSPEEVRGLSEAEVAALVSEERTVGIAEHSTAEPVEAEQAASAAEVRADALTQMQADASVRADTTTTTEFRRYIHGRTIVRSVGAIALSFEVDANGRPQNIRTVSAPVGSSEAAAAAVELLEEGPDWPTEPARKLIIINL